MAKHIDITEVRELLGKLRMQIFLEKNKVDMIETVDMVEEIISKEGGDKK